MKIRTIPQFLNSSIPQPMPSPSYWERETFFKDFDVVILGSGIVGLSAAIRLKELEPRLNVTVVERGALPLGASTRNAGFACFGSASELLDDLETQPEAAVFELVERRFRGLENLKRLLGAGKIRYEHLGGYELFRTGEKARFEACAGALSRFNAQLKGITGLSETYQILDPADTGFGFADVRGVIFNRGEGQLHTGRMVDALLEKARAAGVRVITGLLIQAFHAGPDRITFETADGWTFESRMMLLAANGFAARLMPELAVRPARNQVLVTKPVPGLKFKGSFHYDRGYYYFRDIDGRVLLGGGRCLDIEGETTDQFGTTDRISNALTGLLQEMILPGTPFEIDTWWSGIMGMGDEKKPIIRKLAPNLAAAVRFGGMGVAIGTLAGAEAAEMLLDAAISPL